LKVKNNISCAGLVFLSLDVKSHLDNVDNEIPTPKMKHNHYQQPHRLHPIRLIHRILCMESEFAKRILSRRTRGTAEDMEYLCSAAPSGQGNVFVPLLFSVPRLLNHLAP
jgi:hypothetical protein